MKRLYWKIKKIGVNENKSGRKEHMERLLIVENKWGGSFAATVVLLAVQRTDDEEACNK